MAQKPLPPLRDGDTFPSFSGEPDQTTPPYGIPDPARVSEPSIPHDRRVPNGVKPTYYYFAWKDYKGRYLIPDPTPSFFTRLFGTNEAAKSTGTLHPCEHVVNEIHKCLEKNGNNADYCRSTINVMEGCFREYYW